MAREMKDSGVAWIGEIPVGWSIVKIKTGVYKVGSGKTPSGGATSYTDEGVLFLRSQNVYDTGLELSNPTYITPEVDEEMKGTRVFPNDVLLNITGGSIGRCCIFPEALKTANVNQHVSIIRVNPDVFLPEYMHYYWISPFGSLAINLYQTGGNREGMSAEAIKNTLIISPPVEEQKRICKVLDDKCIEIDNVLEKVHSSIEEYKKLKQAVITQAVTKGTRGDRRMKDSGFDWIGRIPIEWDLLRKLSYICERTISYGIVKLLEPDDENGVKVLRCSDVMPGKISLDNVRTVTQEVSNEYSRTVLTGGEIVINVRGTLGGCAVVPDELKGYNVAREVAVIPLNSEVCTRYFMYFFLSNAFIDYQKRYLTGSVYVGLNIELLSSCPIILPSLEEQEEIVDFLDRECQKIDALIEQKATLLSELEAYKKSLIYEYVTGKKEVRRKI